MRERSADLRGACLRAADRGRLRRHSKPGSGLKPIDFSIAPTRS
jgi:hypothetical protein